jgi:ABC-type Na+ transport system ATPase subunit NatA
MRLKVETPADVGAVLRLVRRAQGVRADDLAGSAGVGPVFVLDVENGKTTVQLGKVLQVLRELRESQGTTILITAEDMVELEGLCDRIAVLENGRLAALDSAQGVKRQLLFQGLQSILQSVPELVAETNQDA